MKSMPRLTKDSEQRISAALTKVAALTNAGEAPTEAIFKIASSEKLPAGHVRLMVRAFNNGRSLGHLRSHDTLEEKAASFPLASASEVLERMFPDEHKTPATEKAASAVSADYNMSPQGWLKRRTQAETRPMTKAASDAPSVEPYPEDPRRQGKKIFSDMNTMRRELVAVKHAAINSSYAALSSIEKLANYFRESTALPFASVRENAVTIYGDRADKLMDKVAEDKIVLKRTGTRAHAVIRDQAPYSLVKAALDAVDTFHKSRAALTALETSHAEKRAEMLRPFVPARSEDVITGSVWDNQSATEKRAVGMMGLGLAGLLGGTAKGMAEKFAPQTSEELIQKRMNEISTPRHEDELRAIDMRAKLYEYANNDPIIKGYSLEEIIEAYNNLSEIAPRAMQQSVMARPLLRKYLEQAGATDPFDMDQLLGVEKKITERDMPEALAKGNYPVGSSRELGPSPSIALRGGEPAPSAMSQLGDAAGEFFFPTEQTIAQKSRADTRSTRAQEAAKVKAFPQQLAQEEESLRMRERLSNEFSEDKPPKSSKV